jgi:hypothetical protein
VACRTILLRIVGRSGDMPGWTGGIRAEPSCTRRNRSSVEHNAGPAAGHLSLSLNAADGVLCAARRATRLLLLTGGPVPYCDTSASRGRRSPCLRSSQSWGQASVGRRRRASAAATFARERAAVRSRSWRLPSEPSSGATASRSSTWRSRWRAKARRSRKWLSATAVSLQAGNRHRDGHDDRRGLHEVIRRDETKPDQLLGGVNQERWLATSWASIEVGRDGGREAQPTAWAATVGHDRPFPFGAREASVPRRWLAPVPSRRFAAERDRIR